jgi:hypothetical protein
MQHLFHTHFGVGWHGRVPNRKTILLWAGNFRETGSSLKQKLSGRPHSIWTPDNIAAVRQAITAPRRSAIKYALALGISDRSVRRILLTDLKYHPYKMMIVQELRECDWLSRQASCEAILENVPADADVLSSYEAYFHLSGCVNKQNFRYWATDNPRQLQERPLHSECVTVWCGIAKFGIIGPYFLWRRTHSDSYTPLLCKDVM